MMTAQGDCGEAKSELYINEATVGKRHLFRREDLEEAAIDSDIVKTPPPDELGPRTMDRPVTPLCGHTPASSLGPAFDPVEYIETLGEDVCARCTRTRPAKDQRED
jgi:hypothetical protein